MKVLQFLSTLVPSFKRDDLTGHLEDIRQALAEETLPMYEIAVEDYKGTPFKSRQAQVFDQQFRSLVDAPYRGTSLEITLQCLRSLQGNLASLDSLVEKEFSRDIVVSGVTYHKATILQLLVQYGFAVDYARQVLLYLLACEANMQAKTLATGKERPAPEIKWLEDNRKGYFRILGLMSLKGPELMAAINSVPEIVVTADNAETIEATMGIHKTDPLALGIVPLGLNPFYLFGIRRANGQVARANRAKNEKRALELRLEQLRMQRRGQEDAALETKISFYEGEVNVIAAKIAKLEA